MSNKLSPESKREIAKIVNEMNIDKKKTKKRMQTSKKALLGAFIICFILISFTMLMIYMDKDTTSLGILATAGVGVLPVMYNIYNRDSTRINLKHMEENYIEDYDDEMGIY